MAVYKAVGTLTTTDFKTIKNGDFVNGTVKMVNSEQWQFEGVLGKGLVGSPVKFSYGGRGSTFRLENQDNLPPVYNQPIPKKPKSETTVSDNTPLKLEAGNESKFKQWQDKNRYSIAGFVIIGIVIAIATFVYLNLLRSNMGLYKAIGTITTTDFRTVKNNDFVTGTITVLDSENSEFNGMLGMGFGLSGGTPIKFRYNTGRGSTFRLENQDNLPPVYNQPITNKPKSDAGVVQVSPDVQFQNENRTQSKLGQWYDKNKVAIGLMGVPLIIIISIIIATFVYFKFIKK